MLGLASLAAQNSKLLDLVSPVALRGELRIAGRSDAQIKTEPGGIRDRAAGLREAARHAAEHAGVPSDGQVRRGFADIQKEAEENRAAHARMVNQGERRIRKDSTALQSDTEARTDPVNQTLLADSIKNGVTQALPSKKQLARISHHRSPAAA